MVGAHRGFLLTTHITASVMFSCNSAISCNPALPSVVFLSQLCPSTTYTRLLYSTSLNCVCVSSLTLINKLAVSTPFAAASTHVDKDIRTISACNRSLWLISHKQNVKELTPRSTEIHRFSSYALGLIVLLKRVVPGFVRRWVTCLQRRDNMGELSPWWKVKGTACYLRV